MDKKSTGSTEKLKDVEVDTIERSIQLKEGAKTKIYEKIIVLERCMFEKRLKSKR